MRSRVLIGVGAWLLGAGAATAGSLLAVEQLGQGIFGQHNTLFSTAMVNAQLALERSEHSQDPQSVSPSPSPSSPVARTADHARRLTTHPASPAASGSNGTLLTSSGGTAMAVCKPDGAYLVYWSPQQGYEADHVIQGPASVASVVFRGTSSGVVMKVTCSGDQPVEHLTPFAWGPDE